MAAVSQVTPRRGQPPSGCVAKVLLGLPSFVSACGDFDHQRVPQPNVGILETSAHRCTAVLVGSREALTSASCVGRADTDEWKFRESTSSRASVAGRVMGQSVDAEGRSDWALVTLERHHDHVDVGARFPSTSDYDQRPASTDLPLTLWWSGYDRTGKHKRDGKCVLLREEKELVGLDVRRYTHDCDLSDVSAGVPLYVLDEKEPVFVGIQGNVDENTLLGPSLYEEAPTSVSDLIVDVGFFAAADALRVYALNAENDMIHGRSRLGGTWLPWSLTNRLDASFLRIDAVSQTVDFLGRDIDDSFAVAVDGTLYRYSIALNERDEVQTPRPVIDVSVVDADEPLDGATVLDTEGRVCARSEEFAWYCAEPIANAASLDSIRWSRGMNVLVEAGSELWMLSRSEDGFDAPVAFGEPNTEYRAVVAGVATDGVAYVVASTLQGMRLRIGDPATTQWSTWRRMNAERAPATISVLESGHGDDGIERIFAVSGDEVFSTTEREGAGIRVDRVDPADVEFEAWRLFYDVEDVP